MLTQEQIKKLEAQIVEQKKTVDFDTREFTLEFLVKKYLDNIESEENDIFVPEYQREFVWDDQRQSRLIESIILGLPIPIIFLAEDSSGRLEIVDGSQRIRTLAAFLNNELVLTDLLKLTELNNLTYQDLPDSRKRKINNTPIRMIVLAESTTSEVKNDLFERINRGSDLLRNMEKRKGIYQGDFTKLIYALCKDNKLLAKLAPLAKSVTNRQEHEELVLRFFALLDMYPSYPTKYRGVGVVLDEYLEKMNNTCTPIILEEKKEQFMRMLHIVDKLFLNGFCKKPKQEVSRIFFEALSVGSYLAAQKRNILGLPKIDAGNWLNDKHFRNLIAGKYRTHTPEKIRDRIDFVKNKILEL